MKNLLKLMVIPCAMVLLCFSCNLSKDYDHVANDPLNTRIYTLDNGLKVYMTVNKEQPRIQANIAVRVGSKNDPAETTGLAHYFEHLMFKGTEQYGTCDYAAEAPLLDEIESLFEVYRATTDETERKRIYQTIDSVSYEASKYAIPNEYDKLMSTIGARGTNAYTSFDVTCYIDEIPSNQIESWAKIQADRFNHCVIRGFHTELETVYEEYNMSLTRDSRKMSNEALKALFSNHPYGTQTTLGTQEHLKNPSITNIKNFYKTWYVPNNMAICLSGDMDPEATLEIIKHYFGGMKANKELPKLTFKEEQPITSPIERSVYGLEAENMMVAWRVMGASSHESDLAELASSVLYNGFAGLLDLNVNQQQKVMGCYAYPALFADHGLVMLSGYPKAEQTLEEVKDILLAEVAKMRAGEFDEELLAATIANKKLQLMQSLDNNQGRADAFVKSFTNGVEWRDMVNKIDHLEKITKDDIVKFANEKLGADNYVVVYKRQGADESVKSIEKPTITPIVTNRDKTSDFLAAVQNTEVPEIEPVFVNFETDMERTMAKNEIEVLYKQNETTQLFELNYVFEMGSNQQLALNTAFNYLDYLGTATKSPEQIKTEFYKIACSFNASVQANRTTLNITGLSENMPQAMVLVEEVLANAKGNEMVLDNMKRDILKSRVDAKVHQASCFSALRNYVNMGDDYVRNTTLSNDSILMLNSDELLAAISELMNYEHKAVYYGPLTSERVVELIDQYHDTPEMLTKVPSYAKYYSLETPEPVVYIAPYEANQIYYLQYSNRGDRFDVANDAGMAMYNEYFGGGMNAIVFQEMREARGLAYSARAFLSEPNYADEAYTFTAFIATQNDKMTAAIDAFYEIIENMPESEAAFVIAKNSVLARLRTNRTIKSGVLWAYMSLQDKGLTEERNQAIFEKVQSMTLADVKAFQEAWVKGRSYHYAILGKKAELDGKKLRELGPVQDLTLEQIFGY